MDIIKLDPDTYLPDSLVGGLSSKIWSERFLDLGDFQIKSNKIAETKAALPKGTFISHRETREVMQVEDLLETTADDGSKEVTVTGRAVDFILEARWIESQYQKKRKMNRKYGTRGAALVLLWQAIDNTSGWDVTRQRKGKDNDGARWPWNTKDVLPNVIVTETTTGFEDENLKRWWLTEGVLYDQLVKILDRGEAGIRIVRPDPNDSTLVDVNRITVDSSLDDLGTINRTALTHTSSMRFDLFRGIDRSHTQDENDQIVFAVIDREVSQPNYLQSQKTWKTGVEMMSGEIEIHDVYRSGDADNTGWNRRIVGYDAGTPDIPDKPEDPGKNATPEQNHKYEEDLADWRNKQQDIITEFREDAIDDAQRLLKKSRKISLFSGNIAPSNPYVYKRDYDLGDRVSLSGEYGEVQKMIVQEYIRTDDAEGDRGFPSLVVP